MNIIIRSQDKKSLIQPAWVEICGEQVLSDIKLLGQYETQEQALCVLEQIQEAITISSTESPVYDGSGDIDLYVHRGFSAVCANMIALMSPRIYEMPTVEEADYLVAVKNHELPY